MWSAGGVISATQKNYLEAGAAAGQGGAWETWAKRRILKVRSTPSHTEDDMGKAMDAERDAVWELIRTKAVRRWQILDRLELLENLLKEGGADWADHRERFLLASAKIDLDQLEC